MKRYLSILFALAVLAATVALNVGAAQESEDASPPLPAEQQVSGEPLATDLSLQNAPVASAFVYQGVLKESGRPVSGQREMTFRLYADANCQNILGDPLVYDVLVDQGLFSVALEVPQDTFDGQALWLETEVGGVALGCQEIQAVPYALGLRPGAVISGTLPAGPAIRVVNPAWQGRAVLGLGDNATTQDLHPGGGYYSAAGEFAGANGVIGAAPADTEDGYGVTGFAHGTYGRGVFGRALAETGRTYGVYGQSDSEEEGYGVFGATSAITGTTYGVYGRSSSEYGAGGYFMNAGSNSAPDLIVGPGGAGDDGRISSDPTYASSDLYLSSNDEFRVYLDQDNDEESEFAIYDGEQTAVFSVTEDGDVRQPRTADGLVKASAYLYCSETNPFLYRSFNNLSGAVTVSAGAVAGSCSIDLNFDLSDRYWTVTAVYDQARFVTCQFGAENDTLDCFRFAADGSAKSGGIMITVY